ncbi:MAG: response regulator receiver modulated sensor-containing diguanylate [Betaproteobacteria bacterium]|nr:response regulator receiver modulated sensor-containing diguanylate [Betaproteobacteria bacterium]
MSIDVSPVRLLLVEDNVRDAELILSTLQAEGCTVDSTCVDGEAGFVTALNACPDLVLCDHALPAFNSTRALELFNAAGLDVPFIIVSGAIGEDHAVQAMQQGADDYLLKDRLTRLVPSIASAMERRRLRRAVRLSADEMRASEARHEERYRATFDQAGAGIAHATTDWKFIEVNRRFCSMLGYTREELRGRGVLDILHPDDHAASMRWHEALMSDPTCDRTASIEKRYLTKMGGILWVEVAVSAVRKTTGEVDYFVAMALDISERKAAEERFRATFEQAAVGIANASLDRRYLMVNQKLCDMLGYTREELLTMRTDQVLHPDDRAISADHTMLLEGNAQTFAAERRYVRKDGSIMCVNRTVSVVRDAAGVPLYFLRVIEDITDRKRAEARAALLQETTLAISQARDVDAALSIVLQKICDTTGWNYGQAWLPDLAGKVLECRVAWHDGSDRFAAFAGGKRRLNLESELGFAGSVFVNNAPRWVPDLTQDGFRRNDSARAAGFVSWCGIPVPVEKRSAALLEFFMNENRSDDAQLVELVTVVAAQLGILIQRKAAEDSLRESDEKFRQLIAHIPETFWISDTEHYALSYISPAVEKLTGRAAADLEGRNWVEVVHVDDRERVEREWARKGESGDFDVEFRIAHTDGTERWAHSRAFPVRNACGEVHRIAGVTEDVTERKQAQERLLHLAHYDQLTALPNRVLFHDRLLQAVAQAQRNAWTIAVLSLDIDRFKVVNDTLGHAVGDKLLQQVAQRLRACVRGADTIGRLGGDEFAVILSGLGTLQDAGTIARHVLASVAEPYGIDGHEIFATASIGIALYPADSREVDTLMRDADAAMYSAKAAGRNACRFYKAEMNARALEKMEMERRLRHALEREEFFLHYQPKVDLATGEIAGLEALLRWNSPESGIVSPGDFIPLLEETGLIVPVGEWVLRAACAQLAAWKAAGVKAVPVAVNLSSRQFHEQDLCELVGRTLREHDVAPHLLELEITESVAMHNAEASIATLRELKALGVDLAIDDFGTGYSSLSYLKRLPIDTVKIDRSFVTDLASNPDDASIAKAIVDMAHNLHLKVVAEGVETAAQLSFLSSNGCDQIQGYYFSRPCDASAITEMLGQNRRLERPRTDDDEGERTLLLLDDEENVLSSLKRLLRRDKYRIFTATSVSAAFEVLAANRVGVIVSDQRMQEATGVEFLRRVKDLYPDSVRMVLSGYTDLESVTDAINQGAIYRFLTKPWDDNLLRAHIAEACRRYAAVRDNQRRHEAAAARVKALTQANENLRLLLSETRVEAAALETRGS